jgi:hypothetical protein
MSTVRELLEQAAKAADEGIVFYGECLRAQTGREWNSLTDDGDAARLATRLRIDILHGNDNVTASTGAGYVAVPYGDDADAAVRRAVTTLAAQIGKTNQPGEAG